MYKRNPYIAAIMLGLVIGGIIWSVIFIMRYLLQNPIEKLDMADLPSEVTRFDRNEFTPFESADELACLELPDRLPPGTRQFVFRFDKGFTSLKSNEEKYTIAAETKSAIDPLRDEMLRAKLRELIDIKSEYEQSRRELATGIHGNLIEEVGTSLFKYNAYQKLASESLSYSMETTNVFPIRQAEAVSEFYESQKEYAGMKLDSFNSKFTQAVEEDIGNLKQNQDKLKEEKVMEIRDYILEKTAKIEEEIRSSNGHDD
ncbi:hypothetical protein J7L05_12840 [bacterium]|nr:hypothetical protein [bacterium]